MRNALSQGYDLLAYLYAGFVTGVLYDANRLIRLASQRAWVNHAADLAFVVSFLAVCCHVFLLTTDGVLRLYGFLAIAFAALIEQWAVGRPICKMIVKRWK